MFDVYFAAPFFNSEQVEREEALKHILMDKGLIVYSPKDNCFVSPEATLEERESTFNNNVKAIQNSKAIFAITDGKDMGTIWECGYAYARNKPIYYFAETLGFGAQFNLMLAQSGFAVFTSRADVVKFDFVNPLDNFSKIWRGNIE